MYLYFNRNGDLKEIINDEALRQGNYGVNKIYLYVEDRDYTAVDVSYLLPSNLIVGPQSYDTFTNPAATNNENCFIPFDPKRDLKYFKYNTAYKFCVINLETDINGNSPLDQTGTVHCSPTLILSGGNQVTLGDVNFYVEENATLNQKYVAPQEYLALADYQFLRKMFENIPTGGYHLTVTGAISFAGVLTAVMNYFARADSGLECYTEYAGSRYYFKKGTSRSYIMFMGQNGNTGYASFSGTWAITYFAKDYEVAHNLGQINAGLGAILTQAKTFFEYHQNWNECYASYQSDGVYYLKVIRKSNYQVLSMAIDGLQKGVALYDTTTHEWSVYTTNKQNYADILLEYDSSDPKTTYSVSLNYRGQGTYMVCIADPDNGDILECSYITIYDFTKSARGTPIMVADGSIICYYAYYNASDNTISVYQQPISGPHTASNIALRRVEKISYNTPWHYSGS